MLSITNFVRGLFARSATPSRPRPTQRPVTLEFLEERTLLSGWAFGVGPLGYNGEVSDLAVDGADNIIVTGAFEATVDFDSSASVANLISRGSGDSFIAKYSSAGSLAWAKRAGSTGGDLANAVTADAAGNIYIAGRFSGTADFGSFTVTSAGDADIFVAKLDSAGNFLWVRTCGATQFDNARDIALDSSGNVVVTGNFKDTVDFNPDSGASELLTSAGGFDVFVWKLNVSGDLVWARRAGSTSDDLGADVVLDASDNAYITGLPRISNQLL